MSEEWTLIRRAKLASTSGLAASLLMSRSLSLLLCSPASLSSLKGTHVISGVDFANTYILNKPGFDSGMTKTCCLLITA